MSFLPRLYGMETGLTFLSYFLVCAPVAVASLIFTWFILSLIYVPRWCRCKRTGDVEGGSHNHAQDERRKRYLEEQYQALGPIR